MLQWYVFYTKSHKENLVAQTLAEHDIETYLPIFEPAASTSENLPEPLFPCYLFARMDLSEIDRNLTKWTPGLRNLVMTGDQAAVVPESLISLLRTRGNYTPADIFEPSELVQIVNGPLQGINAIFSGPISQSKRVEVLFNILGNLNRMQVNRNDLQKIASIPKPEIPKPFKLQRRTRGKGRRLKSQHPLTTPPL